MSVEKVEQYKEYKKHRKEILRKQKQKEKLIQISMSVAGILLLGLITFFIYQDVKPDRPENVSLINWDQYLPEDLVAGEDEATDTEDTEGTENDTSEEADTTDAN